MGSRALFLACVIGAYLTRLIPRTPSQSDLYVPSHEQRVSVLNAISHLYAIWRNVVLPLTLVSQLRWGC